MKAGKTALPQYVTILQACTILACRVQRPAAALQRWHVQPAAALPHRAASVMRAPAAQRLLQTGSVLAQVWVP